MDNHSYNFPSDCTPLTNCKSARKPAGSTVVNMGNAGKNPPRDYLLWSLCNTFYVNFCCLGFMALIYSIKARDQKTLGNLQLAQECSDKAKWYNILAAGWNLLIPLLAIVLIVLLLVHLGSSQGSFDFLGEDGFQNFLKLFSWWIQRLLSWVFGIVAGVQCGKYIHTWKVTDRVANPADPDSPVLAPGDLERLNMKKCEETEGISYHIHLVKTIM